MNLPAPKFYTLSTVATQALGLVNAKSPSASLKGGTMTKGKTLDFKKRQCGHCKLADKRALRKGWNCCPFPNPAIKNGHCVPREPTASRTKRIKVEA